MTDWCSSGIEVYCYFDNDEQGYAPNNAASLARLLADAGASPACAGLR
jgi:uncharacterized protein YecE (DUF72 family)